LDAEVGGIDSSPVALALNKRAIPFIFCTTEHSEWLAGEFGTALLLRNPTPGEKLRAVLQQADSHRGYTATWKKDINLGAEKA
jgi:hypothetical protein